MDDYKIALGALLDANAKGDIDKQLNAIKDLSVTISKATLSNDVINDIKRQLTQNGIDLKLVFGNVSQITNQAKQTGQQIGQQIQNGINDAIQKGNLQKDFFFSADKKNGVAKQAQEYFRGISNGVVTVTEQMENLDDKSELRGFIVNIKNAKGEVESLKYSLRNILDDNGNVTGQKFAYVSGSINDAGAIKQFEELNKVITDYEIKLANLKTKYSNMNVDYSAFDDVFNNFKLGIGTANDLALAFNQLENSAKKGVQSLKSQTSSFDPIQQTLNNMRDLPSMLTALEANMSGVKDKTSIAEISVDKLRESFDKLDAEMQSNGGKVPITDEWLKNYRDLMSTVTSATKQVDALKKAEASDNSQTQKQANYYSTILSNYREIYSLKQKLLTAGKEETKVIQEQIRSLNSSNASINKQLGKQGLKDSNWQTQVDDLKEELDYSLRISEARQKDKANQSSLNNAQREAIQIVEELEQAYQRVQDIKIKIASLDKAKDGEKNSTLSQEEESAQAEYKQLYDRLRKRKNYDKESWNETKSAIDSATKSQIEYNNAASQDTLNKVQKAEIANFRILKDKWDKQGLLVDEFRAKVEAMESSLSSVGSKGELDNLKIDIKDLKTEATQLLEANKAYKKAEKELTATLEKRRVAQANSAKEKAKSNTQQELAQQREVNAILSKQESAYKEIWNINKQIANLDTTEDADVIGALNEKKKFYQDIYLSAQKELQAYNNIVVSHEHLASLAEIRKKAESEIGVTVAKQNKALAEEADRIQLSFDNGHGDSEYKNRIQSLVNDFERYGLSVEEANKKTANLRTILDGFKVDGNFLPDDQLVAQADKLEAEFKAVKVSLDSAKLSYDKFLQPVSSEKASSLIIRINDFLSKNKNITASAKEELLGFVRLLQGGNVNLSNWNKFDTRLKEINIEMREANRLGKTLRQTLIDGAKSFAQWTFSSGAVMELYNVIRKVPKEVIAVNTAMIELIKVSSAPENELKNYFDEAADSAKKFGASISDVISATADFSRLGYNLKDASLLADVAILYKNVGDGISVDEASISIVSTMKAFGIEAENAIRIVDIFNEVGNNFAISSGEIGDALKRSASSLSVAGNSIEESVALITAGNTIVQDADTVGTALKTLSLRITSTSSELEAMGEDTEFACETLSDYRDLVLGLTKNKVNIVGDNGEYKSTYEILKGISEVWDEMNSMEQSALMKALFGARQANIGASILENFDIAKDVMKSAEEATGSALKEQENYEKGIQYSLDRLIAKFQEFSNHILDSKLIKGVVDFGTTTIDVVDKVTSALGSLGTIGLIGGGILSKNGIG